MTPDQEAALATPDPRRPFIRSASQVWPPRSMAADLDYHRIGGVVYVRRRERPWRVVHEYPTGIVGELENSHQPLGEFLP